MTALDEMVRAVALVVADRSKLNRDRRCFVAAYLRAMADQLVATPVRRSRRTGGKAVKP